MSIINHPGPEISESLAREIAEAHFGLSGPVSRLANALPSVQLPEETPDLFAFRDHVYLMRGVEVADYRSSMRQRSPRWGTVHLPTATFRSVVKPFSHFLAPAVVTVEATERG